jgi:hypothetical protein
MGADNAMRLLDGVLEFDALALDLEQHAGFLLVQGIAQLILEGGHLRQHLLDTIVHMAPKLVQLDGISGCWIARKPQPAAW